MNKTVAEALTNIDMVYDDLIDIANDIYNQQLGDIDELFAGVYENVENLTNDDLRNLIVKASLKAFTFSAIKEKSTFKSELAETLRKEAHANAYGAAEGTAAAKENQAILNTNSEILSEEIYDLISNLFKVKLDEIHRVVSAMQTVLTSRVSEAKLINATTSAAEF